MWGLSGKVLECHTRWGTASGVGTTEKALHVVSSHVYVQEKYLLERYKGSTKHVVEGRDSISKITGRYLNDPRNYGVIWI